MEFEIFLSIYETFYEGEETTGGLMDLKSKGKMKLH